MSKRVNNCTDVSIHDNEVVIENPTPGNMLVYFVAMLCKGRLPGAPNISIRNANESYRLRVYDSRDINWLSLPYRAPVYNISYGDSAKLRITMTDRKALTIQPIFKVRKDNIWLHVEKSISMDNVARALRGIGTLAKQIDIIYENADTIVKLIDKVSLIPLSDPEPDDTVSIFVNRHTEWNRYQFGSTIMTTVDSVTARVSPEICNILNYKNAIETLNEVPLKEQCEFIKTMRDNWHPITYREFRLHKRTHFGLMISYCGIPLVYIRSRDSLTSFKYIRCRGLCFMIKALGEEGVKHLLTRLSTMSLKDTVS